MKTAAIVFLLAVVVVMGAVIAHMRPADRAVASSPASEAVAQWSIDSVYSKGSLVKGMMVATAESESEPRGRIQVACSKGFWVVYVSPDRRPDLLGGTATYMYSVDGSADKVGHAAPIGLLITVGDATLARTLSVARRLRFRYTPVGSDSLSDVDFDVRGLLGAMTSMRDTCGTL